MLSIMAPYLFRRESCPFCGQGPLIFVSCRQCGSTFAWCGEEDHAVGRYDGTDLRELGLGSTRDWARSACPHCQTEALGYSTEDQVRGLGFEPDSFLHGSETR